MDMLDLGVGGGRTTKYFAPLLRSYTGTDISADMVRAAQEKYGSLPNARFRTADASKLEFADASFDLVLFSYNGIDCLPPAVREEAIREVLRVLRPGGVFFFSSHNRAAVPNLTRIRSGSFKAWLKSVRRLLKFKWHNRGCNVEDPNIVFIADGAHGYRLRLSYVRPSHQVKQLEQIGFTDVKVFGPDGPLSAGEADASGAAWMHYFCEKLKT